jgi:hypothetical protein
MSSSDANGVTIGTPNRTDFDWQTPGRRHRRWYQQPVVNPQGTAAFWVGEAIAIGTAVGGVVVVAVSPSVILPLDTIGALPPLIVSSPSAVAKAPAATSAAPATSIARIFVDWCMNVPPGLCGAPPYHVRIS